VIGDAGISDSARKSLEGTKLLEPVVGHHFSCLEVGLAAPIKFFTRISTRNAAQPLRARAILPGTTSFPMPSPGMTAILKIFISIWTRSLFLVSYFLFNLSKRALSTAPHGRASEPLESVLPSALTASSGQEMIGPSFAASA